MSNDLIREHTDLQAEASALRQLATELVMELRIARRDAYGTDHAETADIFGLAASILDNRRAGQPLLEENARLSQQRADANTALALTHMELCEAQASSAALIEACEAVAAFIESYTPTSYLAQMQPAFYGLFHVYGKNARAAVRAVRPHADALLSRMADLSRQIGELNTTIGYQDAMLAQLRSALALAQEDVCSLHCPSTWRTADGQPPHSERCQAISAVLEGKAT